MSYAVKYEVRAKSGWMQRGEMTVSASTLREARVKAREEVFRRCGEKDSRVIEARPL